MLDQFFRFLLTLTWLGLSYVMLAIIGVEWWRSTGSESTQPEARFLINAVALLSATSLAYWLQARWVFARCRSLGGWSRYMALMFCLWVLHEVLLVVLLAILPLSYPAILIMSLVASLGLAFILCKKYIF